jgi:Putative transposase DNA-binding domain
MTRKACSPVAGRVPMAELTATATCTAFRAAEDLTGEVVSARLLAERVGLLAALTQRMTATVVAARWNDGDLATVGSKVGPDGRTLPAKGWMALRRLGWVSEAPEGVYLPDRVRRVAEEAAARALRLAVHRRAVVHAIVGSWPADPRRRTDSEWAALRGRLPQGVDNAEIRNRTRQIRAYTTDHGGRLPACLTELEGAPRTGRMVLLAAADKQLVTIQRTGPETAALRIKLPLVDRPAAPVHWAWHTIQLALPGHVPTDARLCVPTLRVDGGLVRVDLPWRTSVPRTLGAGHSVALGLDWGVNTLLTGTVGKLADTSTGSRVISDGRMLRFDATGVSAKLHRLRVNRERVATRLDHYDRLLAGLPVSDPKRQRPLLQAKHAFLAAEHQRICDRIRRLNRALAWAAARWAVDQARALGATVIFVEDLATLETRGRRNGNARLSGQVRGRVVDAIRHLAARSGIATVTVPARGTSRGCPRCGAVLLHTPAPDRIRERGWRWAVCRSCGLANDRDHAASERIVARGLLGQAHIRTEPKTGHHAITMVVEGNVARARRPGRRARAARRGAARGAIPARPRHHRNSLSRPRIQPAPRTPRRVPDRRAVPAPVTSTIAGKRPAGQAPQIYSYPRVGVESGLACDRLPHRGRLKRPETVWGFHRAVRATDVLPLGDYGPPSHTATPTRNA